VRFVVDQVTGEVTFNMNQEPMNEVSQVRLLERDVMVQFLEIRRLQHENEQLKKKLKMIKELL
jgi:hypothetical protein